MMADVNRLRELVDSASTAELPALLGAIETLKAAAWSRLMLPAPPSTPPCGSADLTAEDLARQYGTPKSLFYELARRGDLPHRRIGHYVRFSRDEVERWIAANPKTVRLGTRKKRRRNAAFEVAATAHLPGCAVAEGMEP